MIERKFYYVVTPEFESSDDYMEMTGNKDIDLYEITNDIPSRIKSITSDVSEVSVEVITEYIESMAPELFSEDGTPLFTLIQL